MTFRQLCFAVAMVSQVAAYGVSWTTQASGQVDPSPEALQAAREMTRVMSISSMTELAANLTNEAWPRFEATLKRRNPTIDAETLAELRREFERLQFSSVVEAMNDAAPVYARHFTVEEMRAITAFYRTPAGSKVMLVMPRVATELLSAMTPRMQALQANITVAFVQILQRKGYIAK